MTAAARRAFRLVPALQQGSLRVRLTVAGPRTRSEASLSLRPIPFAAVVGRLVRELASPDEDGAVFEVPVRRIYRGAAAALDLGVAHHGERAANPLGPAAGPHTQLAQNIVAAWLGGSRIFELKTVQVRDDLVIPRPCIDMATVGYNVEWSQELRLAESATEYVKAAMLVAMLRAGGLVAFAPGSDATLFDLSVGYDLAGIRSAPVTAFLDAMANPGSVIATLRAELPQAYGHLGDVAFPTRISAPHQPTRSGRCWRSSNRSGPTASRW